MKKHILLVILSLLGFVSKAQYVTIPDANFVTWLNSHGYSQCMVGNQMDTTCNAVVNATTIKCSASNISNISGIKYFNNLDTLICENNNITNITAFPSSLIYLSAQCNQLSSLPVFPSTLTFLNVKSNHLLSIPSLPVNLRVLECSQNELTSLPAIPLLVTHLRCENNLLTSIPPLPPSLMYLICTNNKIASLPLLQNSIIQLNCDSNQLSSLPNLSSSLGWLDCSNNQLTSLPVLPNNLGLLYCYNNQLTNIPALPNSLIYFWCFNNNLTSLPPLSSSLIFLECGSNHLTSLPALPNSLISLGCSNNLLTSIPTLPNNIYGFSCDYNQITSLPFLPNTMSFLRCDSNPLITLPSLPDSLTHLYCRYCQLTSLPNLPNGISWLCCNNNQLTNIPPLPDSLFAIDISYNPNLYCIPPFRKVSSFFWAGTGITCFPNVFDYVYIPTPPVSTVPICDVVNANNCDIGWKIKGSIYTDINANCIYNIMEDVHPKVKLKLYKAGNIVEQTFSNVDGKYTFGADTGNYVYSIDIMGQPYIVDCPITISYNSNVITPTTYFNNKDYSIHCKSGFDVGVESVSRTEGIFRPGMVATVLVDAGDLSKKYNLDCASGVSGKVKVVILGPCEYYGIASGALMPVVNGDTITYSFADFGALNFDDFRFKVLIDTVAQLGAQICFDVTVEPIGGDNNISNNVYQHCFNIVNSYDPNEKEVSPAGLTDISQYWLTYTIRFQNVGTASAIHVRVEDTLSANIDESSFQLLSYSHEPITQIVGKKVKFSFPNINLADSTSNEPASHGFVQYKVRRKNNLAIGTLIRNTAYIYFDFNEPVVTNTTTNEIAIVSTVGPGGSSPNSGFSVYPNPVASGQLLNLNFGEGLLGVGTIQLFDISGRNVHSTSINAVNTTQQIFIPQLASGIYICELKIGGEKMMRKVVVK